MQNECFLFVDPLQTFFDLSTNNLKKVQIAEIWNLKVNHDPD